MKLFQNQRSLRHRLNLVLVATTVLALTLAGAGLVALDLRRQAQSVENDLVAQASIVGLASSAAIAFDDARGAADNLKALRANPSVVAAALYNAEGRQLAAFIQDAGDASMPPARAGDFGTAYDHKAIHITRNVVFNRENIGTVYLEARHNLVGRATEHLAGLVAIMAASLGAALYFANRVQKRALAPLHDLGDVARQVRQGDFSRRARKNSDDEIGELVDAFNAMVDEIRRRAQTLEQANAALRASEERYQLAVRGSSAGLWDWDMASGTMFYSPRLKALLGYTGDEFPDVPESMEMVAEPADLQHVRAALRDHFLRGKPYQAEVRARLKSGEYRWLMIAGTSLRDERGRPFRMAGSVVDITERKLAENVLRESNRAKDEFIATLAHELRNPLAPVRTGLEILKLDKANGPRSERARETMERQLAHIIRLIDDLLDISRITSGKIRLDKERMRLSTAINSALEISRPAMEAGGHTLVVDAKDDAIEVEGDATRLAQSIGNILNNAAKYTPPGGRISLKAWREEGEAVIEVADNGVGIPPEMLDQVFNMFTQVGKTIDRAQGGLGIGLSLVRSLVGLHGGTVRASSDGPGLGSRFTIRLPALAPAPSEPDAATQGPMAAVSASGSRVMVVDDNVDAAQTLAAVLDILGHPTRSVNDPQQVVAQAKLFRPEVMLLDIGMPGLTGYDLAKMLRSEPELAATKLIAVTGWGSEADRERAREAGFDHHLTKPVEIEALLPLLPKGEEAAA